jgi:hypothetical protein
MRDYAYEALAEVTATDWNTGRGELNAALKSIREESGVEDAYLLADEIHARAKNYQALMPEVLLTPTALAKHWRRCESAPTPTKPLGTNRYAPSNCGTCGGDRFVLVAYRTPAVSAWALERGIHPTGKEKHEEYGPCPECGPDVGGAIDRGRVRELMSR